MKITQRRASVSKDYLYFAGLVMLVIILASVWSIYSAYVTDKKDRAWKQQAEASRIAESFIQSFDYVNNFMKYMGEKIVLAGKNDPETIATVLRNKLDGESAGQDIFTWTMYDFISPEGYEIASSAHGVLSDPKLVTPEKRSWIADAPKTPWVLHTSKPDIGILSGEPIIPVGFGVEDDNGRFLGIISMGFNLEKLTRKLEKAVTLKGLSFVLLDKHHEVVLYSSDQTQKIPTSFFASAFTPKDEKKTSSNLLHTPLTFNNITYSYSKKIDKYPYTILVGENNYLALLRFRKEMLPDIINAALMGTFFLVVLFIFRRQIINPITQLSKSADKIAKGEIIKKLPRSPIYETTNLACQLVNVMRLLSRERRHKEQLAEAEAMRISNESKVAKEEFLTKMRHTLTVPINTILGYSEAIIKESSDVIPDQYKEYAKTIYESAKQLQTMTTNVLNRTEVDVKNTINECITVHKERAYIQNVQLTSEIKGNIPPILLDEVRFRQIIIGTIHHALAITPENETVHVTAYVKKKRTAESYLVVLIEDTGFGMSEYTRQKILDEYNPKVISRNTDGTDLSIADIRKLVTLHQGSFTMEGVHRQGTTFTIRLPYINQGHGDSNAQFSQPNVTQFSKKKKT